VASFLRSVCTCDVDALPTDSLAHRYWTKFGSDHANSADYVRCLRRWNLTQTACHIDTVAHCGRRFGERDPDRLADCNRLLWSDAYRAEYPTVETRVRFERYRRCSSDLRGQVFDSRIRSFCGVGSRQMWSVRGFTSIGPGWAYSKELF